MLVDRLAFWAVQTQAVSRGNMLMVPKHLRHSINADGPSTGLIYLIKALPKSPGQWIDFYLKVSHLAFNVRFPFLTKPGQM